ncbi:MAG: ferredoxin [Gammaproteobacteria bacterium]|nr:ferredoxin [Gammaproteobacteria bacterium]
MANEHRHDMGAGGRCICTKCDKTIAHRDSVPCREERCPECDAKMLREGSHHHELFLQKHSKEKGDS